MAYSNDDLMKYLLPPPSAAPASSTPFNLAEALGLTPRSIGAPPTLGVGQLTPPVAMPAAPTEAPAPSMASLMPAPATPMAAPAPRAPGGGGAGGLAGLQRDERAGVAQQAAGIQAEAAVKGQLSQTMGEGEMRAAAEQRQRLAADAQADAEANAQIAARRKQLYDQADAIGASRVDPNRIFNESSTFSKIAGAIAIGLGGYVATQTKGANVALSLIQKQIDNDIQAQMADLESRKASLGAKSTLLQQEIASGRNAADARHQATVAAYELAIKETSAQGKMLGTDLAKAEAAKLQGALLTDLSQKDKAFWAQQQGLALQGASNAIAQKQLELAQQGQKFTQGLQAGEFARALGKDVTEHADRATAQAAALQAKAAEGSIANFGTPEMGADGKPTGRLLPTAVYAPVGDSARKKEVGAKIAELTPVLQALDANIRDADKISWIQKVGAKIAGEGVSDVIQRMHSREVMLEPLAKMLSGRVTPTNLELVQKAAGDPTAFLSRLPAMHEFRELMRSVGQAELSSVGIDRRWEPPSASKDIPTGQPDNAAALPPDQEESRNAMRAKFLAGGNLNSMTPEQLNALITRGF